MSLDSNTAFNIAPHNSVLLPQKGTMAGAVVPLGTVANLHTPPSDLPCEVGGGDYLLQSQARRDARYQMLKGVQSLLYSTLRETERIDDETGEITKERRGFRVVSCMKCKIPGFDAIRARKTSKGAAFSGILVCSSVWLCPVCAANITNERRKEIWAIIGEARRQGYKPVLMTLTARHDSFTPLGDFLKDMLAASVKFWAGAPMKRRKERMGCIGHLRTLEVTYSFRNGWHPHFHFLVFVAESVSIETFIAEMRPRWFSAAERAGLFVNEHGFDATDCNNKVGDYISKFGFEPSEKTLQGWQDGTGWNEADEMARWHTKKGKIDFDAPVDIDHHFTPFGIAEYALERGDIRFQKFFEEYARVFHGRAQVDGLGSMRKALGMTKDAQEMSDEEAAQKAQEAALVYEVVLSLSDFVKVLLWRPKHNEQRKDGRAFLLELIEIFDDISELKRAIFLHFGFLASVVLPAVEAQEAGG